MKIFVINGTARAGKDTFIEILQKFSLTYNGPVIWNVSSIDKVRGAAILLGWDQVKDEKGRKFLSDLKDLSTEVYEGPFNYMKQRINEANESDVVFLHLREPQEIKKLVRAFPEAKTVFIQRETEVFNNHADKNVENYDYDFYISNNGTLEDYVRNTRVWYMENII